MTAGLEGIRVLDLTEGLAGALTTMILCDNGAEVVKVEPPGGDRQREHPAFAQIHRGKKSVVADLSSPEGRDQARDLANQTDVLVHTYRPGEAEKHGLGYDALASTNPGLVYCVISGFGPKGPYANVRGYEQIVGAKAGTMIGADRPRYAAIPGGSFGAAQGALQGILCGLIVRESTGRGQRVEASLAQGLTAYDLYGWLDSQLPEELSGQPRTGMTFSPISGMIAFTADGGWLQFANFRPHLLEAFLDAVGLREYYAEATTRGDPSEAIVERVLRRIHEKPTSEWMEIFLRSDDIGVEPFRTPGESLDHPQMIHNGHVLEMTDPVIGKTRQLGSMVRLAATPSDPKAGAPALGASPARWAFESTAARWTSPPAAPSFAKGPLTGVTVLELAWFYAAPFGTALLADLGARVIKVESSFGDPHRYMNPLSEYSGVKALGGKESIVIDYRTAEGKEILHKLVARCDLVMRNYRQQNSAAVGDDYESLAPINPEQVYLYAAAYGSDGPYTVRPAFAPTMGVAAGHGGYQLGWTHGLSGREPLGFDEGVSELARMRERSGGPTNNADAASALVVGTALLLGLLAKYRTGRGQYAETTMLCSNAYVVAEEFFDYDGARPGPGHDENGTGPLYRLYPTRSGWVFLAAPEPEQWVELVAAFEEAGTGSTALSDPRFASPADRDANATTLESVLAAIFEERRAEEWEELMLARDVACVEISTRPLSEFSISDPSTVANGFTSEVDHPLFGVHRRHGPIVTLSETPGVVGPGCMVGQHTRHILAELGYSDQQIEELRERKIVDWPGSGN